MRLETLERIVEDDSLPQALVPVVTALAGIPALAVTEPQAIRLKAGQAVVVAPQLVEGEVTEAAAIKVLSAGELVALARLDGAELTPLRIFNS